MKRILSLIHTPVFGGPHNQMLRLTSPLKEQGWDTFVILPLEANLSAERLRNAGIPVLQIPLHRLRAQLNPKANIDFFYQFVSEVKAIQQIIRVNNIDLVQICGLMNPHGAVAAYFEKKPIVWQVLGTTAPLLLRIILMPLVRFLADVMMSTGYKTADAHPGARRFGERLVIFAPPVETTKFVPDELKRKNARDAMNVPDDAILVGTVGNFNKLKGHDFLIDAISIIHRKNLDRKIIVRILGNTTTHADYYEKTVIRKAEELGYIKNGTVRFLDPLDKVADYLPAFDIFALTSRVEGVPTVVLEAMSCGVPIVTTDVGSVSEIVEDGITGLIVPPLDSQAIATKIECLAIDDSLRLQMGQAGRIHAVAKYDISTCVTTHKTAYELASKHYESK